MATIHAFGPFRLDADAETLYRGSEPLPIGKRAVALLRVLIEQAGTPVSKDTLIDAAWSGLAVEESNLTVQIAALRRALGEAPGGENCFGGPCKFTGGLRAPEATRTRVCGHTFFHGEGITDFTATVTSGISVDTLESKRTQIGGGVAHGFWWLDERAGALLSRRCRGGASRASGGRGNLFGRPATRCCVHSSRRITTTQTEAVASANGGAPRSMRSTTLARRNTNARCASARRHVRTAKIQATTPAAHATSATCRKVSNRLLIVPTRTVGGDQTADGSRMDGGRLSSADQQSYVKEIDL